jgi:type IV secretion system protein TrbL
MYLALKIFMLQLEAVLIATLSPMSFALLGLNTLRDQGIAPFKSLLSLAYRIVLVGVMMSAFSTMSEALTSALNAITVQQMITDGLGSVLSPVVSIIGAYLLLAFCLFKSDAIASSLAGGTSAIGASDVTSAAAAGAAAGAAAATGGASAVAGAGKVPQAMSRFMDKLSGGGGSIQDASSTGSGGDAPVFTPPTAPALSVSGGDTASVPVSGGAPAGVSPSRSQPGIASRAPKSNVASGRYGKPYDVETPEADSQAATTTGAAESGQPDQKGAASAGKGALPPEAADEAHGSARGATIGGQYGSTKLEEALGKLADHLSQPSKPKAGQQLRDLDQRLAGDKATVGVSINPHHD